MGYLPRGSYWTAAIYPAVRGLSAPLKAGELRRLYRFAKGKSGVPTGIRTPVASVKGKCPRPLDDGDVVTKRCFSRAAQNVRGAVLVELVGIEPTTSCMPCKRSPS